MGSRQKRQYADLSVPRTHWDLRVELPEDGMRLDRFLAKRVRWRSRNQLQQLIDDGVVSVDGTPRKASTRLRDGCSVVIRIPEVEDAPDPGLIPVDVLLDDGELLLVNKQPALVVHPVMHYQLENLLSALHARYRDMDDPERDRVPHVCHRIDRDTSGAFLVAFSERLKRDVSLQFEDRAVRKEYLALVAGAPAEAEGEIDAPILATEGRIPQLHVHDDGLPSQTRYRVEAAYEEAALVRFFPRTGRSHQIRLHAEWIGHPLLCDETYGGPGPVRLADAPPDADPLLARCALHSARLQLRHPGTGQELDLHAPLADDMRRAVRALRSGTAVIAAP
jgi:23S rRNA pseudouridine1911/1915/1917 synthase